MKPKTNTNTKEGEEKIYKCNGN